MKQSTKKYFKLSLILYVVILSLAVVGTLAWFIFNKSVHVSPEEDAEISAGKNVEICINDGSDQWGNSIKLQNTGKMPDVSMTPDGVFWFPTLLDENDEIITGENGKGLYSNVTEANGYFVKIPLKVKANKALNVYLDSESFVKGVAIEKDTTDDQTTSKDAIAGAARVAFFERTSDGGKELKTIWEPNEKYQLVVGNGGDPSVIFDGAKMDMMYLNVEGDTVPEDAQTIAWKTEHSNLLSVGENALVSRNVLADGTEHIDVKEAKVLLKFEAAGEKEIDIYIWIEGTDRESKTLLSGGSISYEIKLVGVEEKAEPTVNINDVEFKSGIFYSGGIDICDKILWSKDGNTWSGYTSINNPNVNEIRYIRIKETATTKLGPIRELLTESEETT